MKRILFSLLCLCFCMGIGAQPKVPPQQQRSGEIKLQPMRGMQRSFLYNPFGTRDMEARGGFAPLFLIYPDRPCNEQQAMQLIRDLGIDKMMKTYACGVGLVNPAGTKWDNARDFEAYKAMIDSMRVISNLKIIAIGSGATFVNQTIAAHAGEVAGILSINGKAGKTLKGASPVPAYIYGKAAAKVAAPYIAANRAVRTDKNVYANATEPLQRVVIDPATGESMGTIMQKAWKQLLSKNYRFNNFRHTFYMGARFGQYGDYELEPYAMFDELGVERKVVKQNLLNTGDCLWYEYLPEDVTSAREKSVPLVLLLHGHGNDPRTQAETSGWIQIAAREHFFVAELEWQGNGFAYMDPDGVEQVVYELMHKYPQIDPSRIYTEGLSAGAMTSSALGIRKSHLFAAIGAMSGGLFPMGFYNFSGEALRNEAMQKRGNVETAYVGVFGTDDDTIVYPTAQNWKGNSILNAWMLYETMNGMPVVRDYDFSGDLIFGQPVKDHKAEVEKGITVQTGYLYKGEVPLMKLIAVEHYGHWNFQPAAQMMWDHFKHFSRDPETKKLIYN